LSGIGGVGHCLLYEPYDVIIHRERTLLKSIIHAWVQATPGPEETRRRLGYSNHFR
jgi:hypothetical protein